MSAISFLRISCTILCCLILVTPWNASAVTVTENMLPQPPDTSSTAMSDRGALRPVERRLAMAEEGVESAVERKRRGARWGVSEDSRVTRDSMMMWRLREEVSGGLRIIADENSTESE